MTVALLILTYNEIDGVQAVLPKIDRSLFDEILVVDGGSTDGTLEWLRAHDFRVHIQTQKGIRHAYREGLGLLTSSHVVHFHPDGNCDPAALKEFIRYFNEGYDYVVGSRYVGGIKSADDDTVSGFGNWMFTALINVFYSRKFTDVMVGFRGYKMSMLQELSLLRDHEYVFLEKLFRVSVSHEPLMSARVARYFSHYKVVEFLAVEEPRIGGVKKMRPFLWGAIFLLQILFDYLHLFKPVALTTGGQSPR